LTDTSITLGWKRPDVHIPSLASAELFGAEQTNLQTGARSRQPVVAVLRACITAPCKAATPRTIAPLAALLRAHF
jgi:hypothetical protein